MRSRNCPTPWLRSGLRNGCYRRLEMNGQELDLVELGVMPARCLKGENTHPERDRLIAGRAKRGLEPYLRMKRERESAWIWGRRPTWYQEQMVARLEDQIAYEKRRVKVREQKLAELSRRLDDVRRVLS